MPETDLPPFLCRVPGCLARVHGGYCPEHQPRADGRVYDQERGSAARRGYGRAWQRYRLRRLAEQPYCQDCDDRGRLAVAREVHHIVKVRNRPDMQFVDSNTRCLCTPCHSARTARGE